MSFRGLLISFKLIADDLNILVYSLLKNKDKE